MATEESYWLKVIDGKVIRLGGPRFESVFIDGNNFEKWRCPNNWRVVGLRSSFASDVVVALEDGNDNVKAIYETAGYLPANLTLPEQVAWIVTQFSDWEGFDLMLWKIRIEQSPEVMIKRRRRLEDRLRKDALFFMRVAKLNDET